MPMVTKKHLMQHPLGCLAAWPKRFALAIGPGLALSVTIHRFLKANAPIAAEIERRIRAKINEVTIPVEGIEEAE